MSSNLENKNTNPSNLEQFFNKNIFFVIGYFGSLLSALSGLFCFQSNRILVSELKADIIVLECERMFTQSEITRLTLELAKSSDVLKGGSTVISEPNNYIWLLGGLGIVIAGATCYYYFGGFGGGPGGGPEPETIIAGVELLTQRAVTDLGNVLSGEASNGALAVLVGQVLSRLQYLEVQMLGERLNRIEVATSHIDYNLVQVHNASLEALYQRLISIEVQTTSTQVKLDCLIEAMRGGRLTQAAVDAVNATISTIEVAAATYPPLETIETLLLASLS